MNGALPLPTGEFAVGTTTTVIDGIDVRLFFPTGPAGSPPPVKPGTPPPWITSKIAMGVFHFALKSYPLAWCLSWFIPAITSYQTVPAVAYDTAKGNPGPILYRPRAVEKAGPGGKTAWDSRRWPVVAISHGLCGWAELHSGLATGLAAEGRLVLVPNHQDRSNALEFVLEDDKYRELRAAQAARNHHAGVSEEDKLKELKEQLNAWRIAQCKQRAEELRRAVEGLEEACPWAAGAVAVERCAAVGFSFGGATALRAALLHHRFNRLVLLDPWLDTFGPCPPELVHAGFKRPLAACTILTCTDSDVAKAGPLDEVVAAAEELACTPVTRAVLQGAGHHAPNDLPLVAASGIPAMIYRLLAPSQKDMGMRPLEAHLQTLAAVSAALDVPHEHIHHAFR